MMNKKNVLFALMLVICAFFITVTTAYAAPPEQNTEPEYTGNSVSGETETANGAEQTEVTAPIESAEEQDTVNSADSGDALFTVKDVLLTGDMLNISVTDRLGGTQTLELNLSEYTQSGSTDNPFTPDGSGTVIDDAAEDDGKEFFTVDTPDGNTFYLIVDRQRGSENVYLLDAVSEDDLASLAKPGDGKTPSVTETPALEPPAVTAPKQEPPESAAQPVPESEKGGTDTGTIVLVTAAVLIAGGVGYYIKIVRPKKNGGDDYSDDGFNDDTEPDLDGGDDE